MFILFRTISASHSLGKPRLLSYTSFADLEKRTTHPFLSQNFFSTSTLLEQKVACAQLGARFVSQILLSQDPMGDDFQAHTSYQQEWMYI